MNGTSLKYNHGSIVPCLSLHSVYCTTNYHAIKRETCIDILLFVFVMSSTKTFKPTKQSFKRNQKSKSKGNEFGPVHIT